MLCVHDHYKYFNSFSAGTVFLRQNLTYKDGHCADKVKPLYAIAGFSQAALSGIEGEMADRSTCHIKLCFPDVICSITSICISNYL